MSETFGFFQLLVDIDARNSPVPDIFHGLPCAAAEMLYAKYNQIQSVRHGSVSGLVGIFVVASGCRFAYFDFVVVIPEEFLIIPVLGCEIGQHKNMGTVVATVFPLTAANGGRNHLIEGTIPTNQKSNIFFFFKSLRIITSSLCSTYIGFSMILCPKKLTV